MKQVKIFYDTNDKDVNNWIEKMYKMENEHVPFVIHDISTSSFSVGTGGGVNVLVVYEFQAEQVNPTNPLTS